MRTGSRSVPQMMRTCLEAKLPPSGRRYLSLLGVQESSSIGSTSEVTSLGVLMTTPSLTGSLDSAFSSVGVLMRPDSADRFGWTSTGER